MSKMSTFMQVNRELYIQQPDPTNPTHVENYRMAQANGIHAGIALQEFHKNQSNK
jgi:hypothetical protein